MEEKSSTAAKYGTDLVHHIQLELQDIGIHAKNPDT
jgi:hypothetical protein